MRIMVVDTEFIKHPETQHTVLVEIAYHVYDGNHVLQKEVSHVMHSDEAIDVMNHPDLDDWTRLHAIQLEEIRDGMSAEDMLRVFMSDANDCNIIVGHDILTDVAVISRCMKQHNLTFPRFKTLHCTKLLGVQVCNIKRHSYNMQRVQLKWPKLTELYEVLFRSTFTQEHRALPDVRACARVYFALCDRL